LSVMIRVCVAGIGIRKRQRAVVELVTVTP
jgi:hypothetical protein